MRAAGQQEFIVRGLITRARLFQDRAALVEARRLIEQHGYGRRLPELQDAEAAAANWPD